ncbi:MAG: phosphopeptide-binding protein [Bacteroidota bacterium]
MRITYLLFVLALVFHACSSGGETSQTAKEETTEEMPAEATANQYTVTPFSPSQAYPDATLGGMSYENGQFKFDVSGTDYKLGDQTPDAEQKMCANSGKGQHIHLIVDNQPYAARYTAEFDDYQMEDGEHHVLAFLSRSYHESIKTEKAYLAQKVTSKDKSVTAAEDITGPMLFYSRPKGTYVGKKDTEKVMLDFYLANASLGSDYSVKAEINGEVHNIDKWQPYYVEGLPMGNNTIKLTLLDKDGQVADVPLNPVERTFELKADEVEQ